MTAIEVRHLVKRYRGAAANAVDDVSFDVEEGQLFCLLGPNGAGKTTTLSILTTTLMPTSGQVYIAGRDLAAEPSAVRRELGIVFQQPSLDLNLTAEENVRLHAVLYGLYPWRPSWRLMPHRYRDQVDALSAVLGVTDFLTRPAHSLSGGTRRKLEISVPCYTIRVSFFSMNQLQDSIPRAGAACGITSRRPAPSTTPRSFSRPITWRRPRPPMPSAFCPRGGLLRKEAHAPCGPDVDSPTSRWKTSTWRS